VHSAKDKACLLYHNDSTVCPREEGSRLARYMYAVEGQDQTGLERALCLLGTDPTKT